MASSGEERRGEERAAVTTADDISLDSTVVKKAEGIPKCSVVAGPPLPVAPTSMLASMLSAVFSPSEAPSSATASSKQAPIPSAAWTDRLKEEYRALIAYSKALKEEDSPWFTLKADPSGVHWTGKAWVYHDMLRYEFEINFDIPVGYPATPPEICIPSLLGKTPKMYTGGRICMSIHFLPLWMRNTPNFGITHAMALGALVLVPVLILVHRTQEALRYQRRSHASKHASERADGLARNPC